MCVYVYIHTMYTVVSRIIHSIHTEKKSMIRDKKNKTKNANHK